MASMSIPASKASSPTDDLDILYEKITIKGVQTPSCTCDRKESEYPDYVAEELALFHKLLSESPKPRPKLCDKKDNVLFPSEESKGPEIKILAEDGPKNVPIPDEDPHSMDCEVLWVGTTKGSDLEPEPLVQKLDFNGNLEAAVGQNVKREDLAPESLSVPFSKSIPMEEPKSDPVFKSIPMDEPNSDPVPKIRLTPKKYKSSKKSKNREPGEVVDFQCQICSYTLSSQDDLRIHLSDHAKITKKQADIHRQSRTLLEHMTYEENTGKPRKRSVCKYCKKVFITRTDLREHTLQNHSGTRPWKCLHCTKNYTRDSHLKRHMATKHLKKINSSSGRFKCSECSKRYTSRIYLSTHMERVHYD